MFHKCLHTLLFYSQWCMQGSCVAIENPVYPSRVNGGWSNWDSSFSPCSSSCGGGVKVKRRRCMNPRSVELTLSVHLSVSPPVSPPVCQSVFHNVSVCQSTRCSFPPHVYISPTPSLRLSLSLSLSSRCIFILSLSIPPFSFLSL